MSGEDQRGKFLWSLPATVHWDFCRVMDGLSDLDWTRFASEVLRDQSILRLAERREKRTDWVMNQWESRNGQVRELIDLLERLQLLRARDVILGYTSSARSSSSPPPPDPGASQRPPTPSEAPPTLRVTSSCEDQRGGRPLPGPAPPPSSLLSVQHTPLQSGPVQTCSGCVRQLMSWSYEEVHAGTKGFSPSLQVGEGGFGVVYRATLNNIDCAVKRLKQDCMLNWTLQRETFHTEVDKLSKFRHPNIVDLLGVSEGGGSVCLIYSYMDNRSLEEQLHNERDVLSWSHRVSIVEGVSSALSFVHAPPDSHAPLIHGDIKSANILLDRHLEAKLADFGLARSASPRSSGRSASRTTSVGQTAAVRGTLAYLPDEYVRNGELGTAVDVYGFGVVLLEVLTGRRALERDGTSRDRYLKDLVEEVEDRQTSSGSAAWRKELDHRLITGGAAEPDEWMNVVALACSCLEKNRKKRPTMAKVFQKLKDIHNVVKMSRSSSPSQAIAGLPSSLEHSVGTLSNQLSKLGPLEDLDHLSNSSSFMGPCETDESRGFSQYNIQSHFGSIGTSSSLLPTKDRHPSRTGPSDSVPIEDQYNLPPQPSSDGAGALLGPDTGGGATAGLYNIPGGLSPVAPLQSLPTGPSVHLKQCFLEKTPLDEEGRTVQRLSSDDLYGGTSRGPEESDELDYLPPHTHTHTHS